MSDLTPFDLFVVLLGLSFVLLTLAGLVVRRHITTCPTFGLYLLVVFATDSLMLLESYDRMSFWLMKEIALNVLKFIVALELISRAFSRFPGAKATAYRVMGLVMGLTILVIVWLAAGWRSDAWTISDRNAATLIISEFHTRIISGTTLLFVSIAALILWYRLPVESMQKAILIGFVPYLIFFYMTLELQSANLWPKEGWLARLAALAWPVLLGYWAHVAWQPFRESVPRERPPLAVIHGSAG